MYELELTLMFWYLRKADFLICRCRNISVGALQLWFSLVPMAISYLESCLYCEYPF